MMSCFFSLLFFFNDTATTEIYTLSLHDALPIYRLPLLQPGALGQARAVRGAEDYRSEEHTPELQSPDHIVCRLLLEKNKKKAWTSCHANPTIEEVAYIHFHYPN